MDYAFRSFRRRTSTGPLQVLDINATVQEVARVGFFYRPVYKRREQYASRLVLFVDRNGSMTPFHRLTEDLVGAALEAGFGFEGSDPDKARVFYFHNQADTVYRNAYLVHPLPIDEVLQGLDQDWSALIVSDAGAARGAYVRARVQAAGRLTRALAKRAAAVAWLNPMPSDRWRGSSADVIRFSTPMFPMDHEGVGMAIDVLRGVSLGTDIP
jgi:hypothetical protein